MGTKCLQRMPSSGYLTDVLRILVQQFDGNIFSPKELSSFLRNKQSEEESTNHAFYKCRVYISFSHSGTGLQRIYKLGLVERKIASGRSFSYRFVPQVLRDLGIYLL